MAAEVLTAGTSAPIPVGGTIIFNYPTGRSAASYLPGAESLRIPSLGTVLVAAGGGITVVYGASNISVTYNAGAPIPSAVNVQLGLALGSVIPNEQGQASVQNYPDVQIFTRANGKTTWVKPAWATASSQTRVYGMAGGGGGGSGRRGAAGSVRCGGGGAVGAPKYQLDLFTSDLPATVAVGVGAGGVGGAAVTADDTDGNNGTVGTPSNFGSIMFTQGPNPGFGGTNAAGNGGNLSSSPNYGAAGAAASATGGAGNSATSSVNGGGGGGSGGGITSGDVASAGGVGGGQERTTNNVSAGVGGGPAGAINAAGGNGSTPFPDRPVGGGGGGGGGSSTTGAGGDGGNGGLYGGAGAGGGASVNGNNSGKGGNGGDGIVYVITW